MGLTGTEEAYRRDGIVVVVHVRVCTCAVIDGGVGHGGGWRWLEGEAVREWMQGMEGKEELYDGQEKGSRRCLHLAPPRSVRGT